MMPQNRSRCRIPVVGGAAKDIVDGVGDAGKDIIDGVEDAGDALTGEDAKQNATGE